MKVLITGSHGFLGWHTRSRLHAQSTHEIVQVDRANWPRLGDLAQDVDAIIHLAGVNRGTPIRVEAGNIDLASDVAGAVRASNRQLTVVFANSIQSGNDSPYGAGKEKAACILASAAADSGSTFVDVKLPNLFGEHGRPDYNSFVATFVQTLIKGETPTVVDRAVDLLHVQAASQHLIDALEATIDVEINPAGTRASVQSVLDTLQHFHALYSTGDLPELLTNLDVDLFNTLRAAHFPQHYPIPLLPRVDRRGRLTEVVRSHGGAGQTFVSTTKPGITRGEHFHLHKIERFVVLSGEARISLRRLFTDDIVHFDVTGQQPVIVDMPTLWVHNITNTGTSELTTLFWTHGLFDPDAPDTYAEAVLPLTAIQRNETSASAEPVGHPQLREVAPC